MNNYKKLPNAEKRQIAIRRVEILIESTGELICNPSHDRGADRTVTKKGGPENICIIVKSQFSSAIKRSGNVVQFTVQKRSSHQLIESHPQKIIIICCYIDDSDEQDISKYNIKEVWAVPGAIFKGIRLHIPDQYPVQRTFNPSAMPGYEVAKNKLPQKIIELMKIN